MKSIAQRPGLPLLVRAGFCGCRLAGGERREGLKPLESSQQRALDTAARRRKADEIMAKAKKRVFSKVKAVKENARERVGMVPAERVIPDPKQKEATNPKHKKTLADLLSASEGDER